MPAIWDIMRLSYMGTVWDHSGHYETFSWDIIRLCGKFFSMRFEPPPPLKIRKIFFGRFAAPPTVEINRNTDSEFGSGGFD